MNAKASFYASLCSNTRSGILDIFGSFAGKHVVFDFSPFLTYLSWCSHRDELRHNELRHTRQANSLVNLSASSTRQGMKSALFSFCSFRLLE